MEQKDRLWYCCVRLRGEFDDVVMLIRVYPAKTDSSMFEKNFNKNCFWKKSVHEIIIRKIIVFFSFFEHAVTKIGSIPW